LTSNWQIFTCTHTKLIPAHTQSADTLSLFFPINETHFLSVELELLQNLPALVWLEVGDDVFGVADQVVGRRLFEVERLLDLVGRVVNVERRRLGVGSIVALLIVVSRTFPRLLVNQQLRFDGFPARTIKEIQFPHTQ